MLKERFFFLVGRANLSSSVYMFCQIPSDGGGWVAGQWTGYTGGEGGRWKCLSAGVAEDQQSGLAEVSEQVKHHTNIHSLLSGGFFSWAQPILPHHLSCSVHSLPSVSGYVPFNPQLSAEKVGDGRQTSVGRRYGVGHVQQAREHRSFSPAGHSCSRMQD